ncbi:hypothetical protein AQJ58_23715 [Streptomyces sp. DSM 15324]|nr:hypothetical protein AQJ58_23715 [Streptomyces sp. DSM 15324]
MGRGYEGAGPPGIRISGGRTTRPKQSGEAEDARRDAGSDGGDRPGARRQGAATPAAAPMTRWAVSGTAGPQAVAAMGRRPAW